MVTKTVSAAVGVCLLVSASACSWSEPAPEASPKQPTASTQTTQAAAIFTPSDGLTLSQHTPINKWAAFTPELKDALTKLGFDKDQVTTSTGKNLDEQSRQVQDYVVSHLSHRARSDGAPSPSKSAAARATTLVVAPAAQPDALARQYGDYVGYPIQQPQKEQAGSRKTDQSENPGSGDKAEDERQQEDNAYQRLVSSLKLAQKDGMHVVLLSSDLPTLTPDLLVGMSNAEAVGRLQAQQLVSKLELDKASRTDPRAVEVMLPRSASDREDPQANASADRFAQDAFKGVWGVLAPYFRDGRAISPSGLLDGKSSEQDWRAVAFDPGSDIGISDKQLTARMEKAEAAGKSQRIDGVIAMNDFIASGAISALTDMGYTGSSADVNPEISIGDIVGNMTGKKDLQRHAVPHPRPSDSSNSSEQGDQEGRDRSNEASQNEHRWPIITGYGAYTYNIPQIVKGRQWMTGIEDRQGLANELAVVCRSLNAGQGLTGLEYVSQQNRQGRQLPVLSRPLLAVSASNLKSSLIDTGYIKLADAGL
ncbi:hypothetical protein AB656_01965 [Bifidobacterium actinocoloniiforme DSM 22766]|nr:hypothetical protein AB656_01965 [Bifidobacterium actinocoloniiforme DSM 22766]